MLRTRLIVGTLLAALTAGMLLIDERFPPWYPFLFATVALLSVLGTQELLALLPEGTRPNRAVALCGVLVLIALSWSPVVTLRADAPAYVLGGFAAVTIGAFLFEMMSFRAPGRTVTRLALTIWTIAYLGLLPTFLVMMRTKRPGAPAAEVHRGTIALALAIFVPKACDIGAYFTGRLLGRHKMTPVLSPKKTWEGAAGGLVLAAAVAIGLNSLEQVIAGGIGAEIAFGLIVGAAGMLGDLAESMIKRDCERKDASQKVPGFGGVLDVVDSILFAAPVVYWWLRFD